MDIMFDFRMLNQPCIPGIIPSHSWYKILSKYCWIRFVNILLRIFAEDWCSWEILVSFLYYSYVPLSLDVVVLVSDIHLGKFSVIFLKYFLFFVIFILLLLYPLRICHNIFHCSTITDYSVVLISFLHIFSFLLRFEGFSWYVFKLTDISPQPSSLTAADLVSGEGPISGS